MPISWGDSLKVYWPFVALAAINVLGGIYSAGYASGMRSIMFAANQSAKEAVNG
jgi:hypothetical protein